jgi:hypothetical protein
MLIVNHLIAQNWAPDGAEWHYDYGVFYIAGYIKIISDGDTIINNQLCKKLRKTNYFKDLTTYQYDTLFIGFEYTWSDENAVYIFRNEQFFKLYDFNAQPGDWWTIPATIEGVCDSTGRVQVDSISKIVINNDSLRVLYCSAYEDSHWTLGPTIIEKTGPVDSYMLPITTNYCGIADIYEGGNLRCYYDNDFGLYSTGISPYCDYIVNVEKNKSVNLFFNVIPNPADSYIFFISQSVIPDYIEIFDNYGKSMTKININEKCQIVDISGFEQGVYYILIDYNNKQNFSLKFIKK